MASPREPFITDFGTNVAVKGESEGFDLDRYGVWVWDPTKGKHQVVETGNDVEELRQKYAVRLDRIIPLRVRQS